jgi:hypothetical protein
VNDFLVRYLDSISEDLLAYLDEDEELSVDVARRMRDAATALLDGETTPSRLSSEWPDWFHLVGAFVAAYGWEGTDDLEGSAPFLAPEEGAPDELTGADREFLEAIALQLDVYPSEHDTDE